MEKNINEEVGKKQSDVAQNPRHDVEGEKKI